MKNKPEQDSFFNAVYEVVELIPKGRVSSYGAIARYLGAVKSARMVGWAMNNSFSQPGNVPAHRVVNRNGLLTGKHHFPGEHEMQRRLEAEGVRVKNDEIVDFKQVFWDPNVELLID